jgi:hypothetical protein
MLEKNLPKFFQIASEKRLSDLTRQSEIQLVNEIDQESDDYLSNIEEEKYLEYLSNKYSLDTPELDFDNIEGTTGKKLIPAERFPYGFSVRSGQKYERPTIIYHISCSGNIQLLQYYSDIHYSNTPEVFIDDEGLCFEVVNFYNDLEKVKYSAQSTINDIKMVSVELIEGIKKYNWGLERKIQRLIEERKTKINNIVQILGIPIKKRQNLPSSYEIPSPHSKKNISLKPQVVNNDGKVEYILEDNIYLDILNVIQDYGKGFEQYPSISKDKEEEEIRDHFLFVLQPRYNWAATGEAFNKLGKTDILIKYEKAIVFIAECKFWRGRKVYLATISQLFDRYLTWRNSKAAVVIFVENKDFSSVINEVKNITSNHPNFVRFVDEKEETWLNYIFHINNNPSREVKLAVLLFHIPPTNKTIPKIISET